jgi:hypothetical protein
MESEQSYITPITKYQAAPTTFESRGSDVVYDTSIDEYKFWQGQELDSKVSSWGIQEEPCIQNGIKMVREETVQIPMKSGTTYTVTSYQEYLGPLEFSFQTTGFTKLKNIVFQFPADMQGYYIGNEDFLYQQGLREQMFAPAGHDNISFMPQPEYVNLDYIERMEVFLGTEKISPETVTLMSERKVYSTSLNLTPERRAAVAHLGLPFARGQHYVPNDPEFNRIPANDNPQAILMDISAIRTNNPKNETTYEDIYDNHFERGIIPKEAELRNQTVFNAGFNYRDFLVTTETQRLYTMPLWLVSPLFNSEAVIPPGTTIKVVFTMHFYQKAPNPNYFGLEELIVAYAKANANSVIDANDGDFPLNSDAVVACIAAIQSRPQMFGDNVSTQFMPKFTSGLLTVSNCKMIMQYFNLDQQISTQIKNLNSVRPFKYNYLKLEKISIDQTRVQGNIRVNLNVVQNSQLPLEIFIRPVGIFKPGQTANFYNDQTANAFRNAIKGQNSQIESLAQGRGFARTIWNDVQPSNPLLFKSGTSFIMGKGSQRVELMTRLELRDARSMVIMRNDYMSTNDAYSFFENTLNSNLGERKQIGYRNMTSMLWDEIMTPLRVTMAPTREYEVGEYPRDKQATFVTLDLTFKNPFPLNQQIDVYALVPETAMLHPSGVFQIIRWPAIPINSSVMTIPTINTQ